MSTQSSKQRQPRPMGNSRANLENTLNCTLLCYVLFTCCASQLSCMKPIFAFHIHFRQSFPLLHSLSPHFFLWSSMMTFSTVPVIMPGHKDRNEKNNQEYKEGITVRCIIIKKKMILHCRVRMQLGSRN